MYNCGENFEYTFVNGINLIIGGNGTGKTTFINIIKYALIGLYRSSTEAKMYKYTRKDRRKTYPYSYFMDRTDKNYPHNTDAKVQLLFNINNNEISITRSLYSPKIIEVSINKTKIIGKIIEQEKYDLFQNDNERIGYLQYNYEKKIAGLAGLSSFDDLIYFIVDVLVFDERRNTVLWDSEFQNNIMLKYFTSPEDNIKYHELTQDIKYNDSLSRHKSEDARALKPVLKELLANKTVKNNSNELTLNKLYEKLELITSKIENLILIIENNIKKLKSLRDSISLNELEFQEKEKEIEIERKHILASIWNTKNPKYSIYEENIKKNNICPMCNKKIQNNDILIDLNTCFLCHQPFLATNNKNISNSENIKQIKNLTFKKKNLLVELENLENTNKKQNSNLTDLKNIQLKIQLEIIKYEKNTNSDKKSLNNQDESFLIVQNQYNQLIKERDTFADIRLKKEIERKKLADKIQKSRININKKLSNIFADYAEEFMGLKSELKFIDDQNGIERYIPYIDEIPREDSEALSESQRFFIDHSFRMSILEHFYTRPSFFICETPEGSLDISYEKNAANVFLKFLRNNNALLLTINLNNNAFIRHIVREAKKAIKNIGYINLLEIGKKSSVHNEDMTIKETFNEIRRLIDG